MGNDLQPSHPSHNSVRIQLHSPGMDKLKKHTPPKLFLPSFPESPGHRRTPTVLHAQPSSNQEENACVDDDVDSIYCCKHILYCFWRSEIETMNASQYQDTAVLFYTNVFQLLPEIPTLFSKPIELQAKQFFGMFRWLITNLKGTDNQRWKRQIALLGTLHRQYNIKPEWYTVYLQAFNQTMKSTVGDKYTPRIQFNLEQLHGYVQNVMLQRDFESIVCQKTAMWLNSIQSVTDCLEHKEAVTYLECFMREQFCVEWLQFYQDHRTFKKGETFIDRQSIAKKIMDKYVVMDAPRFITVRPDVRNQIFHSLKRNDNNFVFKIFDDFSNECHRMIQRKVWVLFKSCVNKLSSNAGTKNTAQNIEY